MFFFKERDIFFSKHGKNIGDEEDGKGEDFLRPVIILRKYNNNIFTGISLTSKNKIGQYYFSFNFIENKISTAILSQTRLFDSKRLGKKIGVISEKDFKELKKALSKVLKLN